MADDIENDEEELDLKDYIIECPTCMAPMCDCGRCHSCDDSVEDDEDHYYES